MTDEPIPPESIPAYVRDGLDRQDAATLRDVVDYCERRIGYLESKHDEDELVEGDEELVEVAEEGSGTLVVKRVPCGKDCNGCPHGPYAYRVEREGTSLNWEYLGPATE